MADRPLTYAAGKNVVLKVNRYPVRKNRVPFTGDYWNTRYQEKERLFDWYDRTGPLHILASHNDDVL
jgi:hypothetical protein